MHHFFVDPGQIDWDNKRAVVKGPDVHHMVSVLRLGPDHQVSLSDGRGTRYTALTRHVSEDEVIMSLLERHLNDSKGTELPVILVQGIAKGSKMDWIIQKNTEMGIKAIQPLVTRYTVVTFSSEEDEVKKQSRWQKIAAEASKQSKRTTIPKVEKPQLLKDYLTKDQVSPGKWLRLLAHEKEEGMTLKEVLHPANLQDYDGIELWVGSEGGFSEEEVASAKAAGVVTVGLGPRILRTETAGVALLTVVQYEMGALAAKA